MAVVLQLGFAEVASQDGVDHALPSVQVLLQFPGILRLAEELRALVNQGVLGETKNVDDTRSCEDERNLREVFSPAPRKGPLSRALLVAKPAEICQSSTADCTVTTAG